MIIRTGVDAEWDLLRRWQQQAGRRGVRLWPVRRGPGGFDVFVFVEAGGETVAGGVVGGHGWATSG